MGPVSMVSCTDFRQIAAEVTNYAAFNIFWNLARRNWVCGVFVQTLDFLSRNSTQALHPARLFKMRSSA